MLTGLLLAAAVATVAPPTATVLANRTAFNQPCVWFTSTAPDRLAAAASAALEHLGWTARFTGIYALDALTPPAPHKPALVTEVLPVRVRVSV